MTRDRLLSVGTAVGPLGVLVGSILSTTFRTIVSMVLGLALVRAVLIDVGVLLFLFLFAAAGNLRPEASRRPAGLNGSSWDGYAHSEAPLIVGVSSA